MHYVVSETLGRNAPRTAFHSLVTCGIMSDHVTMLLCIHVPMRSMKAFMPRLAQLWQALPPGWHLLENS